MRPSPEVLCRQVKDGAVLIHMGTNQIYDLNRTGYRVWQLLQEGSDADAISDRLREEFDIDQSVASNELDALLRHLSAEGLIEAEK